MSPDLECVECPEVAALTRCEAPVLFALHGLTVVYADNVMRRRQHDTRAATTRHGGVAAYGSSLRHALGQFLASWGLRVRCLYRLRLRRGVPPPYSFRWAQRLLTGFSSPDFVMVAGADLRLLSVSVAMTAPLSLLEPFGFQPSGGRQRGRFTVRISLRIHHHQGVHVHDLPHAAKGCDPYDPP